MKTIVFAVISILVSVSHAGLPNSPILEGEPLLPAGIPLAGSVVKAESLCPDNMTCFVGGTIITLEFEMTNGCMSLGEVNSTVIANDDVEVEAFGVIKDAPIGMELICPSVMVYERSQLSLVNVFPPFKVSFKGTDVAVDVIEYTKK